MSMEEQLQAVMAERDALAAQVEKMKSKCAAQNNDMSVIVKSNKDEIKAAHEARKTAESGLETAKTQVKRYKDMVRQVRQELDGGGMELLEIKSENERLKLELDQAAVTSSGPDVEAIQAAWEKRLSGVEGMHRRKIDELTSQNETLQIDLHETRADLKASQENVKLKQHTYRALEVAGTQDAEDLKDSNKAIQAALSSLATISPSSEAKASQSETETPSIFKTPSMVNSSFCRYAIRKKF